MVTLTVRLADGKTAEIEMPNDSAREALDAFLELKGTWVAVKSAGSLEKHVRYDQIVEVEAHL